MFDRRAILAGLGASALAGRVQAKAKEKPKPPPEEQLFKTGALARNGIAAYFTIPAKPLVWPAKARLLGPDGKSASIETYRGKLLVVDLWADWCTPCLRELAGIAYHRSRATTDKFELIPICTGSNEFTRPSHAKSLLAKIGAPTLETWIDNSGDGRRLIDTVCIDPKTGGNAVPCMLIIDPEGQIRGHALGGFDVTVETGVGAGQETNAWNTNVSTQFIAALKAEGLPPA